ncbi:MAG: hypothetical protein PHP70_11815 [Gallionella sp.]|nr:hypothetical protein [Gallionella sp.]
MKKLILAMVLAAIGIALPHCALAKVDAATLDKQRALNKAGLKTALRHRATQYNSETEARDRRSLKLDAIPPSPRRSARTLPARNRQYAGQ